MIWDDDISFISIHALRGEGDNFWQAKSLTNTISIHALRGEGDNIKINSGKV